MGAPSRIFFFCSCCLSGCVHTVRASCLNLCFSPALCARPRCQSPAPPSPPPPPPPAPASGGARTDRPAPPGRDRRHRCRTSTRTTRDSVGLRRHPERPSGDMISVIKSSGPPEPIQLFLFPCFSAPVPRSQPHFPQRAGGVACGGGHHRIYQRLLQRWTAQPVSVLQEKRRPSRQKRSVLTPHLRLSVSPPDAW